MRTLISGRLMDVAPVNTPAYEDTSVGARSVDAALESLARKFDADLAEVRTLAASDELTKFFKRTDGGTVEAKRSAQAALAKALSLQ